MVVAEVRENKPDYTSILQASTSFTSLKPIGQRCRMARPIVKGLRYLVDTLLTMAGPFTVTWQCKDIQDYIQRHVYPKEWMRNTITKEGVKSWNTNPF